ncbi:hypothetical protein SK128_015508, partial [Halocaridina rubra]
PTHPPSRCYYYCAYDGEVYCCGDDSRPSEYKSSDKKTLSTISVKLPDPPKSDKQQPYIKNVTIGIDSSEPLPNYIRLPLNLLQWPASSPIHDSIPGDPPDNQPLSPSTINQIVDGETLSETESSGEDSSLFSPLSSLLAFMDFSAIDLPSMEFPPIFPGFQARTPKPEESHSTTEIPSIVAPLPKSEGPVLENLVHEIKFSNNQKREADSSSSEHEDNISEPSIWLPILTKTPALNEVSRTKPASFHNLPSGTVISVHKPSTFLSSLASGGPIVIDDDTKIKSIDLSDRLVLNSQVNQPTSPTLIQSPQQYPTLHSHDFTQSFVEQPAPSLPLPINSHPYSLLEPYPPNSPFAPVKPPAVVGDFISGFAPMPAEPLSYDMIPPSYDMVPPPLPKPRIPPPQPDFDVNELDELLNSIFCECEEDENGNIKEECECGDLQDLVLVFPPKPLEPYIFVPLSALPSKHSSDSIPPVLYREQVVPVLTDSVQNEGTPNTANEPTNPVLEVIKAPKPHQSFNISPLKSTEVLPVQSAVHTATNPVQAGYGHYAPVQQSFGVSSNPAIPLHGSPYPIRHLHGIHKPIHSFHGIKKPINHVYRPYLPTSPIYNAARPVVHNAYVAQRPIATSYTGPKFTKPAFSASSAPLQRPLSSPPIFEVEQVASQPNFQSPPTVNTQLFSFSFPDDIDLESTEDDSDEQLSKELFSEEVLSKETDSSEILDLDFLSDEIFDDDDNDDDEQIFSPIPTVNILENNPTIGNLKTLSIQDQLTRLPHIEGLDTIPKDINKQEGQKNEHSQTVSKNSKNQAPQILSTLGTVSSSPTSSLFISSTNSPLTPLQHPHAIQNPINALPHPSNLLGKPAVGIPLPPQTTLPKQQVTNNFQKVQSLANAAPLPVVSHGILSTRPQTFSTNPSFNASPNTASFPTIGIQSTRPQSSLAKSPSFPKNLPTPVSSSHSVVNAIPPVTPQALPSFKPQRLALSDLLASSSLSALQNSISSQQPSHITFSSRHSSTADSQTFASTSSDS